MASAAYTNVSYLLATQQVNLVTDALKIMLLGEANGGYSYDPAHHYVNPGSNGPTSLTYNELNAAGYSRGFGGAGRKPLLRAAVKDDNNRQTRIIIQNVTWPLLGGAQNDVIRAAAIIKEGTTDADSLLIAYWSLPATPTTATDYTLIMDSQNGNLRILV